MQSGKHIKGLKRILDELQIQLDPKPRGKWTSCGHVWIRNHIGKHMPELPAAETFRRYLKDTSLRKTILDLEVRDKRIPERISSEQLEQSLVGY